jgi:hypothetical protein
VALNVVKGSTSTERGRGGGGLSSVPGRVGGEMTNREMGGGLITTGQGEGGRVRGEGHSGI